MERKADGQQVRGRFRHALVASNDIYSRGDTVLDKAKQTRSVHGLRQTASGTALAITLLMAGVAHAQTVAPPAVDQPATDQTDADTPAADIVVTGSRITASGFTAPTPTQVIGEADIARSAQPNIFNAITQLPSLMGSTGRAVGVATTSSGTQGLSSFSLRGLGAIRTLTLLDGQRFVGANVTGVPDVSQFPQLLVQRVDVVNGGASASYGSDAIGGVINFVTDKRFTGFKANLEGGVTTYGDDASVTAQAAWGGSFLEDRLHVVVSGEYGREGGVPNPGFGITGANGRDWYVSPAFQVRSIAGTPAGQPQISVIQNAQQFQYAKYGLITSGPLQGTAFGLNGAPFAFQYGSNGTPTGTGAVTNCITPFCVGGDTSGVVGAGTTLASKLERLVGYIRTGYDVAADNEIYATFNAAQVRSENSPNAGAAKNANLTIQCSNPFVPASIQAACVTNNITSFQFGTSLANFPDFISVKPKRTNLRGVIGATGKFPALGTRWSYDAYYEYGHNYTDLHVSNISLNPRFNAAIQAVRAADGSIVCASAAARASGCVPFNVIGNVTNSQAALDYIIPKVGPFQHTWSSQHAASASINGQPASTWAGPISLAFGYEYRREWYKVRSDPYGNGIYPESPNSADYPADPLMNTVSGNNWYAGNYHSGGGKYDVHEGFAEVDVPVLDSDDLGRANLNAAIRETHYSTSGWIASWKVGGTWETPVEGVRLRAVTSRDVRAPNLSELFAAPAITNNVVNDPRVAGGRTVTVTQTNLGNPGLRPEVGRNTTGGIVVSGSNWLPGFNASIDYYSIKVKNVVSAFAGQQQVDLCLVSRIQQFCNSIFLDSNQPNGNFVNVQAFNLASIYTNGFDMEASYRRPLSGIGLPGTFTLRALATHVIHYRSTSGIPGTISTELAGVNQGSIPDWKILGVQSWDTDRFSLSLTERWFSDGVYSNEFVECRSNCPAPTAIHPTIDTNHMAGAFYLDAGGSYNVTSRFTAYFKIDNLLNRSPEPSPQTNVTYGFNPLLYDVLGRTFRAGLRYGF